MQILGLSNDFWFRNIDNAQQAHLSELVVRKWTCLRNIEIKKPSIETFDEMFSDI